MSQALAPHLLADRRRVSQSMAPEPGSLCEGIAAIQPFLPQQFEVVFQFGIDRVPAELG
jgi:hypothetical protein